MSRYKFKGYTITNCGYHQPDHCVWWEAVNDNGEACFHGNTLREVEFMILDYEWEQKMRKKDEEIERLKREKIEVETNALAVGGIVEEARTAEKSSAVGSAAAMREALVKAKKAICHQAKHVCQSLSWENSNIQSNCADVLCAHRDLCEAKTAIQKALSAPARNCDKFADAEIARQAWLDDADNWDEFGSPKLELYEWLFAQAA